MAVRRVRRAIVTAATTDPAAMPKISDLRLAELLSARLCHDLIGPVSAIGNGAELLAEDGSEFAKDAVALIADSARRASARLQFYRFAYGFGRDGSRTGPAPHELAAGFFAGSRTACDYPAGLAAQPLEWHKLACNLLLAGAEGLPRGGRLALAAGAAGPELAAQGTDATPSAETVAGLALRTPPGELNSRTVQAYFTGLLAQAIGCRVLVDAQPGRFRLFAAPR